MTKLDWCCGTFQGLYDDLGRRGFAIAVLAADTAPGAFVLQHRAVDQGDAGPLNFSRPLALMSEVHIHYCPWCGQELGQFYRERVSVLVRPGARAQ